MNKKSIKKIIFMLPVLGTYYKFRTVRCHNKSFCGYLCFLLRRDKTIYWPRKKGNKVILPQNITVGMNSSIGGEGCYIQGVGKLIIGNNVDFTTNVGILSGNHSILNQKEHIKKTTIIGDDCWVGMNSVILPGIELGPRTVVGAGSVVTKSFPEGYCVIAGNPAKKVKEIDKTAFVPYKFEYDFYGYIPAEKFEKFKAKYLQRN